MNLLAAKIYYDGSHWIAIPHTERPYRRRRQRKKPEKSEELQQFEKAFTKSKGKRKTVKQSCCMSSPLCSRTKMRRNSLWKNTLTG